MMNGEVFGKALVAAVAAFALAGGAAEGDAWLTFGTAGPDRYADGSAVLDGESYALVWTANAAFGGLAADGSPAVAGDRLIVSAPLAKDGRCPETIFQVSRRTAEELAEGAFSVVLLDTRTVSGGTTALAPRVNGKPKLLNGWGEAAGRVTLNAPGGRFVEAALPGEPAVASVMAAVPAGVKQPRIMDIRLDGANVLLTVENLGGYVRAQGGPEISADRVTGPAQEAPADGAPVVVVLPRQGARGFFRAVGN